MSTYGCNISTLSPQSLGDRSSDPNPSPPVHNCDPLLPSKPLVALRGSQALAGWCLRQRFPWTVGPWGYPNSNNSDSLEWKTLSNWIIWGYPYFRKHPFGPSKADSNGLQVFARQTQAWPSLNSADSRDRPHDTVLEKMVSGFPLQINRDAASCWASMASMASSACSFKRHRAHHCFDSLTTDLG